MFRDFVGRKGAAIDAGNDLVRNAEANELLRHEGASIFVARQIHYPNWNHDNPAPPH
jgi:hypothetical protein